MTDQEEQPDAPQATDEEATDEPTTPEEATDADADADADADDDADDDTEGQAGGGGSGTSGKADDPEAERIAEVAEHIDKARTQAEDAGILVEEDEEHFADSGVTEAEDDQTIAPPG